jgi:hypothetical protein
MAEFIISPIDGSIQVEGCKLAISKGLSKDTAATALSKFFNTSIDHKNGYEWLSYKGVRYEA